MSRFDIYMVLAIGCAMALAAGGLMPQHARSLAGAGVGCALAGLLLLLTACGGGHDLEADDTAAPALCPASAPCAPVETSPTTQPPRCNTHPEACR